ncbi:MAG: ABC transporter permease subunit/CPBP intramembrane protease [Clostridium sp.]
MRFSIVKKIFKKEITYLLRDKKTVFLSIILPMLIYPVMIVLFSQIMTSSMSSIENKKINLAIKGNIDPALMDRINGYKGKDPGTFGGFNIVEVDDYNKAIADEKILAYIEVGSNGKDYYIATNSSQSTADIAYGTLKGIFEEYKQEKINQNLIDKGLNAEDTLNPITFEHKEIAKTEELAGSMVGRLLPIILVASILIGVVYLSVDVMAGEKERGTLETLLTLPISNLEIVAGKYLAVSLCAIFTAFCNIASIALSVFFVMSTGNLGDVGFSLGNFEFSTFIYAITITIICICLFAMVISALSMCICSLAKSYKEAQNFVTPLTLVVLMLSYASLIPTITLNFGTAGIPFVNISLLIRDVLSLKIDTSLIMIVLVSNLVLVMLSVILLSKMFNSEEVLFGSSKEFTLLERRSNIPKGNMPGVSDGIIMFGISVLVHIYLGSYLQMNYGMLGLALSLIILAAMPICYGIYVKADFKKLFSLRLPRVKHVFLGIGIWIIGLIAALLISTLLIKIFPQSMDEMKALEEILLQNGLLVNMLVVAVIPAICEETLFRGFIYGSLSKGGRYKLAIWVSAILFGAMHLSMIKLPSTTILGLVLAYSLYRSGSILVPIIIHFINNAFSVISLHYGVGKVEDMTGILGVNQFSYSYVGVLVIVTILFLVVKRIRESKKA